MKMPELPSGFMKIHIVLCMVSYDGSFLCPKSILVMFSANLFIRVSLAGLNKDWVKVILGIRKANSQNFI